MTKAKSSGVDQEGGLRPNQQQELGLTDSECYCHHPLSAHGWRWNRLGCLVEGCQCVRYIADKDIQVGP